MRSILLWLLLLVVKIQNTLTGSKHAGTSIIAQQ